MAILKPKDDFKVLTFHPVVKETIVSNLLETGRQHMHQVAPDEFRMSKGDLTFWFSRFFASG